MRDSVKLFAVVGLVSISQPAAAQDSFPVRNGDVLTADILNELDQRLDAVEAVSLLNFEINEPPCDDGTVYKVSNTPK